MGGLALGRIKVRPIKWRVGWTRAHRGAIPWVNWGDTMESHAESTVADTTTSNDAIRRAAFEATADAIAGALEPRNFDDDYQATAAERAALQTADLMVVNVDLPHAIETAMRTVRRAWQRWPELKGLPIAATRVADVQRYAGAAVAAHSQFRIDVRPKDGLEQLYREAIELRARLRSDLENLALNGLVNPRAPQRLKYRIGHSNVGFDLLALTTLYDDASGKLAARSALAQGTVAHAAGIAGTLLTRSAERRGKQRELRQAADERCRAFTLLFQAYEELRRAIVFARWDHGDGEELAPSLHAARGAGRPKQRHLHSNSSEQPRQTQAIDAALPVADV
jgi:hypothetical protein